MKHNLAQAIANEKILTKALLKARDLWEISNRQLAKILGVSESSITRLSTQDRLVHKDTGKEWELAVLFLRCFRSLESIMDGHVKNEIVWLNSYNKALKGIPIELMQDIMGISTVLLYLDASRGQ